MADGVVSLVDVMGIAVYDRAGTLLRAGADRGAGPLDLTENEIRGLIEMTQEDLPLQSESGGPFPVANMYAALAPSLPAGYSIDEFAAAYADAYANEPEALAAQVMRGQLISADAGLLRVQTWLLLIDGFVGRSDEALGTGSTVSAFVSGGRGVGQVPPGSTLGWARQNLPALSSMNPALTAAEWAELVYRMPTLAYNVQFEAFAFGGVAHEGHGDLGDGVEFYVLMGPPSGGDLYSRQTGGLLLSYLLRRGASVTWNSDRETIWNAHGSFDDPLGRPIPLAAVAPAHGAGIGYTPKQEEANGSGTLLHEYADIYATADQLDLVLHSYDLGFAAGLASQLISGRRRAWPAQGDGYHPIDWHQAGNGYFVTITWTDVFDGISDTITFRGLVDKKAPPVEGIDVYLTGKGTATGSRPGWKSCNPGIDVVPSGSGMAVFEAGIQGDLLTIAAFPDIDHPLAGIFAGPFTVPAQGGAKTIDLAANPAALCPHAIHAVLVATPIGDPRR